MCEQDVERCPTLADLVCASEGELSPAESIFVSAHLRRCAACRERARLIEATMEVSAALLAAEPRLLAESDTTDAIAKPTVAPATRAALHVAPSPARVYGASPLVTRLREEQFREEQARQARFAERLHTAKQSRIHHTPSRPFVQWLSVAAMGPLLAAGLIVFQSYNTVVRADELLQRAVTQERNRPAGLSQRVRVRLTPEAAGRSRGATFAARPTYAPLSIVRELADGNAIDSAALPIAATRALAPNGTDASLPQLLEQHHLDWQHPLSIARFQAWRESLPRKRDQLLTEDLALVLRTTTNEGRIREAELVVRRDTLQVIRLAVVLDGIGRLEIETLAEWVRRETPPAAPAAGATTVAFTSEMLEETELDARLVLGYAGLDLGQAVQVSSTRDAIRVEGIVNSAADRRAASVRLAALPRVRVLLRAGDAGETGPAKRSAIRLTERGGETPVAAVAATESAGLSRWLERTFSDGPGDARRTFVPELTGLVWTVQQRLTTLNDLALRYASAGGALTPAARLKLQELLDLHYRALNADLHALDARLAVLFGSASRSLPSRRAPADWARRAATGLAHAATLDRLVQELLTHEDLPPEPSRLEASSPDTHAEGQDAQRHDQVSAAFGALWETVNGGRSDAGQPE